MLLFNVFCFVIFKFLGQLGIKVHIVYISMWPEEAIIEPCISISKLVVNNNYFKNCIQKV